MWIILFLLGLSSYLGSSIEKGILLVVIKLEWDVEWVSGDLSVFRTFRLFVRNEEGFRSLGGYIYYL